MKPFVKIVLHTVNGDVVTVFRSEYQALIEDHIADYLKEGKTFTVEQMEE